MRGYTVKKNYNYKRAESNLLVDEKGPHHFGQVVVWVYSSIHLHLLLLWKINFMKLLVEDDN